MNGVKCLIAVLVLSACYGVGRCQEPSASPLRGVTHQAQFQVLSWRVLGPFRWRPDFAQSDPSVTLEKSIARELTANEKGIIQAVPAKAQWQTVRGANGVISLDAKFGTIPYRGAVAASVFDSPSEKDAVLIADADDGIRVWVNGELATTKSKAEELKFHYHYAQVHLKQGPNHVVAKLVVGAAPKKEKLRWRFVVGFTTWDALREEENKLTALNEIETPLIGSDGQLRLDLRLFGEGTKVTADILDANRIPVKTLDLDGGHKRTAVLKDLPNGLYFCEVHDGVHTEALPFHKGDFTATFRQYESESKSLLSETTHAANITVLSTRFEHLVKPENRREKDHIWASKIALLFAEWHDILEAASKRRDAYVDVPGTHIRGIRSPVDGQMQHYIVHVPKSYTRSSPIPLVIVVPFFEAPLRPFLESSWPAKIDRNHEFAEFADESGMAYLMVDNRGNTYGSDFGEADMFATIEQVKHDYAIDPSRIYLFGTCSGGREALALAAKYPDQFAAVGLVSPEATFSPQTPLRPTDPMSVVWLKQKSPIFNMTNLSNVPVYDIHGDHDDHTSIGYSYTLHDAAAKAKIDFHLDVVEGAGHWRFAVDPLHVLFPWFLQHRLVTNPDRVVLTTTQMRYNRAYWAEIEGITDPLQEATLEALYRNGSVTVEAHNIRSYVLKGDLLRQKTGIVTVTTNGEESFDGPVTSDIRVQVDSGRKSALTKTQQIGGPLSDIFTGPFVVVVGTSGGADRAKANTDFANFFRYTWKQRYFVDCPMKNDSELTSADVRDFHLVLIGDAGSNALIGRLAEKLPFHAAGGKVVSTGRSWDGNGVTAQYVYPNPLNLRRYIAVLGVPPCLKCPADATQLTLKGWYDFAVWKWDGTGNATLLDIGRFDQDWTMPPASANVTATAKGQ